MSSCGHRADIISSTPKVEDDDENEYETGWEELASLVTSRHREMR